MTAGTSLLQRTEAERLKKQLASAMQLRKFPSDEELAVLLNATVRKKPVKTLSGVSVVTVVAPIFSCPHGKCIYCPGGKPFGTPQSYTGEEAVVKTAASYDYDPRKQAENAVQKLRKMGHSVDKVELIIIGGTFTATSDEFQRHVIKECLDGLHGVSTKSLEEALDVSERSSVHVSGITVETKPDWAKRDIAVKLVEYGVTRVEIGVQALDDEILAFVNRGHTIQDVVEATADLKDTAFKVCYHIMPNLPGSSPAKDLEMFTTMFEDERFRPDQLKIYPTLVLPGTGLEILWRKGLYKPYSDEELVKMLAEFMRRVPPYVRISRIQREIPLHSALDGLHIPNLRQVVEKAVGNSCRCIRCREHGHINRKVNPEKAVIRRIRYRSSGGLDYFVSVEDLDADALLGFVRVRIPSKALRPELEEAGLVRELHVYGAMKAVGTPPDEMTSQHRGFGRTLMSEAEHIIFEEHGLERVAVISGVGVRNYYRKLGYKLFGPYMVKNRGENR
ncbi:MAG: tRNA uridine(34) 5-carboxymethylaminomethyl modification radical SAM/GNAT enzyme Elp3 [Candidatus Caldarchaeum sp.]|nr:tRNA uridine(34) 5-carboxymethylaminomethyl modification radical SAM/GNAT enzyme Elp3 [Candidatus Caldarchaeum sp.]